MGNAVKKMRQDYYTYADYLEWDDDKRYELIDGDAYQMSAPSLTHQRLSMEFSVRFGSFLRGKPCSVFAAPFDVRLFPQSDFSDATVVQPDLLVVCDKGKLNERGCAGAPDLVIEIDSPSNDQKLMLLKFQKYLRAGVKEYWIVYPEEQIVQTHRLKAGHYLSTVYEKDAVVPVSVLPGLSIDLKTLWEPEPAEAAGGPAKKP